MDGSFDTWVDGWVDGMDGWMENKIIIENAKTRIKQRKKLRRLLM